MAQKGGPGVPHIIVLFAIVSGPRRLFGFVGRLPALVAAGALQECVICRKNWWIGICPRCGVDAFD
jgi:hypothetical protein